MGTPVQEILIEDGRAVGVRTAGGEFFRSQWVVSNADYKMTFLEMLAPEFIPPAHLEQVHSLPYTGSKLCVYLGFDPAKVELSGIGANHIFFRKRLSQAEKNGLEDFNAREVEICLWSQNMPDSAPPAKATLVLRASFPYDHFEEFRTGEKRRTEGYRAYKKGLAKKLVQTVESLLPGLGSSIEVMEVATPLTYRDWGNRRRGSIAGWSWSAAQPGGFGQKLLVETPIERLLTCGIYSVTELFWGGVPTAMATGLWAADKALA